MIALILILPIAIDGPDVTVVDDFELAEKSGSLSSRYWREEPNDILCKNCVGM